MWWKERRLLSEAPCLPYGTQTRKLLPAHKPQSYSYLYPDTAASSN